MRVRFRPGAPGTAVEAEASDAGFTVDGVDGGAVSAELVVRAGATAGAGAGAATPRFNARYDRYDGAANPLPFALALASLSGPGCCCGDVPVVQISMRSCVVSSGRFESRRRP